MRILVDENIPNITVQSLKAAGRDLVVMRDVVQSVNRHKQAP